MVVVDATAVVVGVDPGTERRAPMDARLRRLRNLAIPR